MSGPHMRRGIRATRPAIALVLSAVGGFLIAGYSAFALNAAWKAFNVCNPPPPGYVCHYDAFWGFPPPLFLTAALLGLAAGFVLIVGGLGAYAYPKHHVGLGALMLGASLTSLLAYGGIVVGALLGIAGAFASIQFTPRRMETPPEWSGALPPGAPPPRSGVRALPDRPTVNEWEPPDELPAAGVRAPPEHRARPPPDRVAASLARLSDTNPSSTPEPTSPPSGASPRSSSARPGPLRTFRESLAPFVTPAPESTHAAAPPSPPANPPNPEFAAPPRAFPRGIALENAPSKIGLPPPPRPRSPSPPPPQRPAAPTGPPITPSPPPMPKARSVGPSAASGSGRRMRVWTCPKCQVKNAPWSEACTRCQTPAPPLPP